MSNPFENKDGTYLVLKNDDDQYSFWPDFAAVPAGWTIVFGKENLQACLDYIRLHWTDMRPKSLYAFRDMAGS